MWWGNSLKHKTVIFYLPKTSFCTGSRTFSLSASSTDSTRLMTNSVSSTKLLLGRKVLKFFVILFPSSLSRLNYANLVQEFNSKHTRLLLMRKLVNLVRYPRFRNHRTSHISHRKRLIKDPFLTSRPLISLRRAWALGPSSTARKINQIVIFIFPQTYLLSLAVSVGHFSFLVWTMLRDW